MIRSLTGRRLAVSREYSLKPVGLPICLSQLSLILNPLARARRTHFFSCQRQHRRHLKLFVGRQAGTEHPPDIALTVDLLLARESIPDDEASDALGAGRLQLQVAAREVLLQDLR